MFEFIINGPWYIIPAIVIAMLSEVIFDYERIKTYTDLNEGYIYLLTIIIGTILGIFIILTIS